MNSKILNIKDSIKIAQKLTKQNKTIVIAGGFFDILHEGHIKFLKKSKKLGDYLFILLEDDNKAKQIKGPKRPINSQKNRAMILSALPNVDYIILLKNMTKNSQYDKIILQISPSVITSTSGDQHMNHKIRQAKLVNGKVICVIKRINQHSTSKLAKQI